MDGEGSIRICKHKQWRKGKRILYPYPRVAVGNTDFRMLEKLKELCGGRVYNYPRRRKKHKPYRTWVLYRKAEVKDFLSKILPYLICKKEKALEVIDWIEGREKEEK